MRESIFWLGIVLFLSLIIYPFAGNSLLTLLFGNFCSITGLVFASRSFNRFQYACDRKDPLRKALGFCTLGAVIWLLAQIMEIYCELVLKLIAYGTVADAIWCIGYFPIIWGLFLILLRSAGNGKAIGGFRSATPLIVASTTMLFGALIYFVIFPQIQEPGQKLPEKILDVIYPALDFVLVLLSLLILSTTRPGEKMFRFSLVLSFAFCMTLAGDAILGLVKDFHSFLYASVDIYYYISYFLMAIAADLEFLFLAKPVHNSQQQPAL